MYTAQKNVQIIIALLKKYNIKYAVISPGGRNMPLSHSLEKDPFFKCYSVVDERSAAYFAIGISLENNAPVLLSCTSAQATRNYLPGMTEAYYRGIPLVVATADYKPSLIGQGTMQAIEQMSIPKDSAKISVQLPVVKDTDDANYCARLVNEALLELDHHGSGPVHIDFPTGDLWVGSVDTLPVVKKIDRYTHSNYPALDSNKKIIVAIGEHQPFSELELKSIEVFAKRYNCIIYTNHLSNYHGLKSLNANLVFEGMDSNIFKNLRPDLIITIGDQNGDYSLDNKLKISQSEHWRVHEDGVIRDTYGQLTNVFECTIAEFFTEYANRSKKIGSTSYYDTWHTLTKTKIIPKDLPLSHAYIAYKLAPMLPKNSVLHLGILSSLRSWNYFDVDPTIACYSNVAAFGIDGCLSTFIGQSVASDKLNFLIIGDLSFFYDMNAMGIRHIKNNARVVLVNNNGGGEFRLYNHPANEFGDEANKHIAATGHNASAEAWVKSVGWDYIAIKTKSDLDKQIAKFTEKSDKPIVMEVFTTMHDDSVGVKKMIESNSRLSAQGVIYRKLDHRAKRAVKKILKK